MNITYWILGIIAGVWLASIIIDIILLRNAPRGYEDETGFHLGEPEE